MDLRIMPLFTVDSGDDTTVEKQLDCAEKAYKFHGFRLVFWPYRTKNSKNTIPSKDLIGPHLGEAIDLWRGAARLYGAQISYILPIVFAEFKSDRIAGITWDMPKHGLIGTMMTGGVTKPMCTINTRICTRLTTAHEICHAAGLEDQYEDKNRLTFGIGTTREGYLLEPLEVQKVGASSFAY